MPEWALKILEILIAPALLLILTRALNGKLDKVYEKLFKGDEVDPSLVSRIKENQQSVRDLHETVKALEPVLKADIEQNRDAITLMHKQLDEHDKELKAQEVERVKGRKVQHGILDAIKSIAEGLVENGWNGRATGALEAVEKAKRELDDDTDGKK